jgi:hypothetical protein
MSRRTNNPICGICKTWYESQYRIKGFNNSNPHSRYCNLIKDSVLENTKACVDFEISNWFFCDFQGLGHFINKDVCLKRQKTNCYYCNPSKCRIGKAVLAVESKNIIKHKRTK